MALRPRTVAQASDVHMTLARTRHREVGVQNGIVFVDSPTGQSFSVVHAGDSDCSCGGDRGKRLTPATPDEFPGISPGRCHRAGMSVSGKKRRRSVVLPEMARPCTRWRCARSVRTSVGPQFFRLFPDSTIRVRYWVDRPGPSQVVILYAPPVTQSSDRRSRVQWRLNRRGPKLANPRTESQFARQSTVQFGAP